MKQREKILLGAVAGLVALWQISPLVFSPLTTRWDQIAALDKDLVKQKEGALEVELAARKMAKWKARSLPAEPHIASTLYQHWLIELAAQAKLNEASVSPGRTIPHGTVYTTLPFSLNATCRLAQLCTFLEEFRKVDLLHRVAGIKIESSGPGRDPELRITLSIEGISLADAPKRTTLFPKDTPVIKPAGSAGNLPVQVASITGKNLFTRGYNGPPPPVAPPTRPTEPEPEEEPTPAAPPAFDPAPYIFLVAAFVEGDEREAWLYDRTSNRKTILTEGTEFAAANRQGTVLTIGRDFILVRIGGETQRLELGRNLTELQRQPTPVADVDSGS